MNLRDLSDRELGDYIRNVERDIASLGAQIETAGTRRKRTLKIIRATFLTAGGFFAATFDLLGIALTLFGVWDWVEVFVDDAREMNRQAALHRAIKELESALVASEEELLRRSSQLP
jgi:hypothetical protein